MLIPEAPEGMAFSHWYIYQQDPAVAFTFGEPAVRNVKLVPLFVPIPSIADEPIVPPEVETNDAIDDGDESVLEDEQIEEEAEPEEDLEIEDQTEPETPDGIIEEEVLEAETPVVKDSESDIIDDPISEPTEGSEVDTFDEVEEIDILADENMDEVVPEEEDPEEDEVEEDTEEANLGKEDQEEVALEDEEPDEDALEEEQEDVDPEEEEENFILIEMEEEVDISFQDYIDETLEIEDEPEELEDQEVSWEPNLWIHADVGLFVIPGDEVTLRARVDGLPEDLKYAITWEINKGEGWEVFLVDASFYTFSLTEENYTWGYRFRLTLD